MRACADIPSEGLVLQAGPEDLLLPFATGISSYSETYEAATLLLEVAVSTIAAVCGMNTPRAVCFTL